MARFNIILSRVNNINIKQKRYGIFVLLLFHQHQIRSGKIKANKTQQILIKTKVFFVKTELQDIWKKVRRYVADIACPFLLNRLFHFLSIQGMDVKIQGTF